MYQHDQSELRTKAQQLLHGPLKHARAAALAAALVPLASLAAAPASAQTSVCASGGVCGSVFNDSNNNGIIDAGETGLGGVQVTVCQLCNGTDDTIGSTDANGFYSIFVLGGTYTVSVPIPPGAQPSPLNTNNVGVSNGTSSVATVFANGTETDFGFFAGGGHTLNVTITATCACTYTVTASGNADPNAVVGIDIAFTVTQNGIAYPVTKHIDTNADANGNFSVSIPDNPLPGGCVGTIAFSGSSGGEASFTFNGATETGFHATLPATLFCNTPRQARRSTSGRPAWKGTC